MAVEDLNEVARQAFERSDRFIYTMVEDPLVTVEQDFLNPKNLRDSFDKIPNGARIDAKFLKGKEVVFEAKGVPLNRVESGWIDIDFNDQQPSK